MKKTMKYEAPEMEVTKFDLSTRLMTILPDDGDEDGPTIFDEGIDWISVPDLETTGGLDDL